MKEDLPEVIAEPTGFGPARRGGDMPTTSRQPPHRNRDVTHLDGLTLLDLRYHPEVLPKREIAVIEHKS
jgi:hypothetical protein